MSSLLAAPRARLCARLPESTGPAFSRILRSSPGDTRLTPIRPNPRLIPSRPYTGLHELGPVCIQARQRKTIVDEYRVREANPRWKTLEGGSGDEPSTAALTSRDASPTPAVRDVAAAYRALRKGAEEANDTLTASDFYFGEMEMRRVDERSGLLWVYWLVSGYGTRWLRSASAYFMVVAIAVAVLLLAGMEPGLRLGRAITFALSVTVYAAKVPDGQKLTGWGTRSTVAEDRRPAVPGAYAACHPKPR